MKPKPTAPTRATTSRSSIHPQGWVPVETSNPKHTQRSSCRWVAFTPKGGCPLKQKIATARAMSCGSCSIHPQGWVPVETRTPRTGDAPHAVAFTPKGGCPLKPMRIALTITPVASGSIHPQGWVPVETGAGRLQRRDLIPFRSIHPQGWVPVETPRFSDAPNIFSSSIHPQGWVPVETTGSESTTAGNSL